MHTGTCKHTYMHADMHNYMRAHTHVVYAGIYIYIYTSIHLSLPLSLSLALSLSLSLSPSLSLYQHQLEVLNRRHGARAIRAEFSAAASASVGRPEGARPDASGSPEAPGEQAIPAHMQYI